MQCPSPLLRAAFAAVTAAALLLPNDYANAPARPLPPPPPPDMANTLIGLPVPQAQAFIKGYRARQAALKTEADRTATPDTVIRAEGATIDIPMTLAAMGAPPPVEAAPDPSLFQRLWASWTQTSSASAVNQAPCAFPEAVDDRARFDMVVATLSTLRAGGVTVAERKFERACLGSIPLPADMAAFDDNRLTALAQDKTFRLGFTARRTKCPESPVTYDDHKACRDMLQYFSDGLRGVYNLKSVPVYLVPLPPDLNLHGVYVKNLNGGPGIIINSNPQMGLLHNRPELFRTLVEESRHASDASNYTIMTKYPRGFDDRRFMHTAYLQLNWVGAYTNPATNYTAYHAQYVERTAKDFADNVMARFMPILL